MDTVDELQSQIEIFEESVGTHNPAHHVKSALHASTGPACSPENVSKTVHRHVSWESHVIDNEHMNKLRTDDEFWDPK